MARLNTPRIASAVRSSFITSEQLPTIQTALGAPGYLRFPHSALYLLGVSLFAGEGVFHEDTTERMNRFTTLVANLAVNDPQWTAEYLGWLRGTMNIRTAAIIGAAEFVRARSTAGVEDSHTRAEHSLARQVVNSVLLRADEPTELLAYWTTHYGKQFPQALRKGINDAVARLWHERALVKWDSPGRAWRFADVLNLLHSKPGSEARSAVFKHALDRRYTNGDTLPAGVPVLRYRRELMAMPVPDRRQWLTNAAAEGRVHELLDAAGMTWEALAGWLQGPMDAAAWEAIIPSMKLMGLIRNLRNFDQAGVSDTVAATIAAKLADPAEVAASRLLPFRFVAAYRAAPSLRWSYPLNLALDHSVANVPALEGRTLVLVDRSPSMWWKTMSDHSAMSWADAAATFGAALALRAEEADLVEFGHTSTVIPFDRAESALTLITRFGQIDGTDIPKAVAAHFKASVHNRVVIITDEQTRPGYLPYRDFTSGRGYGAKRYVEINSLIPPTVPVYVWNLGGYEAGHLPTGLTNRHCMGGLTDSGFQLIPLLESGVQGNWPWKH